MTKNYYQILQISENSSIDEIKKSYKKLALKYHPDKNKASNAHEKFIEINLAYEILKDPQKRKEYDLKIKSNFKSNSDKKENNTNQNNYYSQSKYEETNSSSEYDEYYKKAEAYANMSYDMFERVIENIVKVKEEAKFQIKSGCGLILIIYSLITIIASLYSMFTKSFEGFYVIWILIHLVVGVVGFGLRIRD